MNEENDGLGSFDLDQIGMQSGAFGGARILKYVTDHFETREKEIIGPEREFVVLGLKKLVQKFVHNKLVSTIVVPDGERAPDIKEMNEKAPRDEWGVDPNGKPCGPFVLTLVLKLLDPVALDRFAYVTTTVGGAIAIGELTDKIKIMRRFNRADASPVVSCRAVNWWIKRLNAMKKKPDFHIVRWMKLGDAGLQLPPPEPPPEPKWKGPPTLSAPALAPVAAHAPAKEPAAAAPAMAIGAPAVLGAPVHAPTLKEELDDGLPW